MDRLAEKRVVSDQVSFIGTMNIAAAAAQYTHAQLKNPAASGKILLLRRVVIAAGAGMIVGIGRYDGDLASLSAAVANKRIGSTVANVGQVRFANNAAKLLTAFKHVAVPTNDARSYSFPSPFVISAGQGIGVFAGTVQVEMFATFEWDELAG